MATTAHDLGDARPLAGLHVRDAMRPGVLTAPAQASIGAVARIMTVHQVHVVVLAGAAGEAPGDSRRVVSDLDLVRAAVEGGPGTTADAAATTALPAISADATLDEAAARMAGRSADHVVVTREASPAPVGVLSAFDVVTVLAHGNAGGRPADAPHRRPRGAQHARPRARPGPRRDARRDHHRAARRDARRGREGDGRAPRPLRRPRAARRGAPGPGHRRRTSSARSPAGAPAPAPPTWPRPPS